MTICHKQFAHTTGCNIFMVHTCVGTRFGAVNAYHRLGAYFAFWSWVAGAVAGCRCKVLLSECCVHFGAGLLCSCRGAAAGCRFKVLLSECCLRFGAWLLQGAAARCCRVLFALWSLVAGALQGAAAECGCWCCCGGKLRQVLSRVQGFFSFSPSLSGPEGPWWVGMPLSLV